MIPSTDTIKNEMVVSAPGFLAPVISLNAALQAYQLKKDLIENIFHKDVDYGTMPGASKPCLYKAGAEKAASFFGLRPIMVDAEVVNDFTGEHHGGEPFFYYRRTCNLYKGDVLIASVDGSCNSFEKKYRYRASERRCPVCDQPTIRKSKFAPKNKSLGSTPGWYCYEKQGGCGAEYAANDTLITEQQLGQIKNPDVADLANTILKMADKRALVAAILIATGLSDHFTQDIEDFIDGVVTDIGTSEAPKAEAPAKPPSASIKASTNIPKADTSTLKINGMKTFSAEAAQLFSKHTGLSVAEASKTLQAGFNPVKDVTPEQIEAYAREWAGLGPGDPLPGEQVENRNDKIDAAESDLPDVSD